MHKFYDLKRVPENGRLILPISMAAMATYQRPIDIYNFLVRFGREKVKRICLDVVLIYTNGLYFNSDEISLKIRKKTCNKMMTHIKEFRRIIAREQELVDAAIHIVPWDFTIIHSMSFVKDLSKLEAIARIYEPLQEAIRKDLKSRPLNEATIRFVLEESIISHYIREQKIPFPKTLVDKDAWNLIMYPGPFSSTELFLYQRGLLLPKSTQPYATSVYNLKEQVLYDYAKLKTEPVSRFTAG